jgi:hypothetical protein
VETTNSINNMYSLDEEFILIVNKKNTSLDQQKGGLISKDEVVEGGLGLYHSGSQARPRRKSYLTHVMKQTNEEVLYGKQITIQGTFRVGKTHYMILK